MGTATERGREETQIRALADKWVDALRAKDIDRMMSNYSPDILVFGISAPLQYRGAKEYRKKWELMFDSIDGPLGYEVRDRTITTRDDVAFMHCVNRISAKMKGSNEEEGTWMRVTGCYQKIDGKWLVTHEHVSVPIDPAQRKALLDLEP